MCIYDDISILEVYKIAKLLSVIVTRSYKV